MELEAKGVRTVTICTSAFAGLAKITSEALGGQEWPVIVIPHPMGGIDDTELAKRVEAAWPMLEKWLRTTVLNSGSDADDR
jgi:hypothetical protein